MDQTEYNAGATDEADLINEPSVISGEIIDPEDDEEVIETDQPLFPDHIEKRLKEVQARVETQTYQPDDTIISMLLKLYETTMSVEKKMDHLDREFAGKIRHDTHKEKVIDNLHQELQAYKDDILKKYLKNFVTDIIHVIDNIRRLTSHYGSLAPSEQDSEKLLGLMDGIPSDLEDIFFRQGIKTYRTEENIFDARRQRVLKKIETSDLSKDKTVAESLRPGYEWDGQILRPEMVAVYVYQEKATESEVRSSDEQGK